MYSIKENPFYINDYIFIPNLHGKPTSEVHYTELMRGWITLIQIIRFHHMVQHGCPVNLG